MKVKYLVLMFLIYLAVSYFMNIGYTGIKDYNNHKPMSGNYYGKR
jgi:hypothetical protein